MEVDQLCQLDQLLFDVLVRIEAFFNSITCFEKSA